MAVTIIAADVFLYKNRCCFFRCLGEENAFGVEMRNYRERQNKAGCHTGFYGREKLREKLKCFGNFWWRTFAVETFAARSLWGEESFVHGTGRMRRRDRLLLIEQRQQASTPFTRHRETGQSDTQTYGNQVGDATSGAKRFQSKQRTPQSHPLWHKLWTQALSTYVVFTAGPSQAKHLVVKVF